MKTSKTALFLFELMIVILIFAVAAAVCTQIFVKSFVASRESRALTMGAIGAQTMAEEFKAGDTDPAPLYFDKDWESTEQAEAYYSILPENGGESGLIKSIDIRVYAEGEDRPFYSLKVKRTDGR